MKNNIFRSITLMALLAQSFFTATICIAAEKPKTVAVFPSKTCKDKKFAKQVKGMIEGQLKPPAWKVLDDVGTAKAPESKLLEISKAKIHIMFEFAVKKLEGNKISLTLAIAAYEPTSSRQLGSDSATSSPMTNLGDEAILKGFQNLTEEAMKTVLKLVEEQLAADMKHGRRYYVILKNAPERSGMRMNSVLRKACSRVKVSVTSKTQVSFRAECKLSNQELLNVVKVGIYEKLYDAEYELLPSAEGQIVVVFK
jgi:hypothetical protein